MLVGINATYPAVSLVERSERVFAIELTQKLPVTPSQGLTNMRERERKIERELLIRSHVYGYDRCR